MENLVEQRGNDPSLSRNESNGNRARNAETLLQLDYVHPFSEKIKLETGLKGIFRDIDSDFEYRNYDQSSGVFVLDELRSDQFDYLQNVLAGYASFSIELSERWSLLAGARYEGTRISGDFANVERDPFGFTYANLLPSTTLNYQLSELSNLKFSYGQRIQRPDEDFINPYVALSDPRDITVGNPLLLPEVTNQYELTYNQSSKSFNFNVGTFYRATRDIIEPILNIIDDGVSLTTYQNIGKSSSLGLNLFASITLKDRLQVRGNATIIHYQGEGNVNNVRVSNSGAFWNGNLNLSYTFSKTLRAEVNGFYAAPRVGLQGSRAAYARSSFGVRKELWKRKASIGILAVQPFAKFLKFPNRLEGANFTQFSQNAFAQRSYGISFSYRFGKLDFKERREGGRDFEGAEGF
jgi:outer membrane receptor protein involved in Fe transport